MSAPFGIEFYTPIESLNVIQELGQGAYIVAPATPHPLFETFVVRATPSLGVVWIKGITPAIENDNFGSDTRAMVDRLAEQLTQKYGAGERTDLLLNGSIWSEPQDWMSSLNNRERFYHVEWKAPRSRLPDNLQSIFMGATPFENFGASIVVEYASRRSEEADAELERGMADFL